MFKRAQGNALKGSNLRSKVALVFLVIILVWAAAPGKSPSRLEEFLLSPFALAAGLPTLVSAPDNRDVTIPEAAVKKAWEEVWLFEERVTRPAGKKSALFADVLAMSKTTGAGRWPDFLLLSAPLGKDGVELKAACLAKVRTAKGKALDVLIGFIDQVPQPRIGTLDRLLCRIGLQQQVTYPDRAWVRLLHSRSAEPEPLRLAVTVGGAGAAGEKAIVGPGNRDDKVPLRLLHPAVMEQPANNAPVYTAGSSGPFALQVQDEYLVGTVARDTKLPELTFVRPVFKPSQVHCVQILRPGGGVSRPPSAGPLGRGVVKVVRASAIPGTDLRGINMMVLAGSSHGVRQGAAVVVGWSLVGKVVAVGPFHCQVALPGDASLSLRVIATRMQGGRVVAIYRGQLRPVADGSGRNRWEPDQAGGPALKKGDRIWTAPAGLDLPKGLFVGQVTATAGEGVIKLATTLSRSGRPTRVGIFRFGKAAEGKS